VAVDYLGERFQAPRISPFVSFFISLLFFLLPCSSVRTRQRHWEWERLRDDKRVSWELRDDTERLREIEGDRRKERPDRGGPDQWVDGGSSSGDSGEAKPKSDGLKADSRRDMCFLAKPRRPMTQTRATRNPRGPEPPSSVAGPSCTIFRWLFRRPGMLFSWFLSSKAIGNS